MFLLIKIINPDSQREDYLGSCIDFQAASTQSLRLCSILLRGFGSSSRQSQEPNPTDGTNEI